MKHCSSHDTQHPLASFTYKMPNNQSVNHDSGTRLQALTLTELEIAVKIIEAITQLSRQFVSRLKKQARVKNYNSKISKQLRLKYVIDASRSDRFIIIIFAVEQIILKTIRKNRNERKKIFAHITAENKLSFIIILKVLKRNRMKSCKTTKKFCFTKIIKKTRLQFYLRYKD